MESEIHFSIVCFQLNFTRNNAFPAIVVCRHKGPGKTERRVPFKHTKVFGKRWRLKIIADITKWLGTPRSNIF